MRHQIPLPPLSNFGEFLAHFHPDLRELLEGITRSYGPPSTRMPSGFLSSGTWRIIQMSNRLEGLLMSPLSSGRRATSILGDCMNCFDFAIPISFSRTASDRMVTPLADCRSVRNSKSSRHPSFTVEAAHVSLVEVED